MWLFAIDMLALGRQATIARLSRRLGTIAADTELDSAVEQVRTLVRADPRVLEDPVPSVLLDRRAVDALEIVAGFSTADEVAELVKSDLTKAVHTVLDTHPGKQSAQPA